MLKKKPFIWLLLALPALIWFPLPVYWDLSGKKFWGRELVYSGYIGVSLLTLSLLLTPLVKLFPAQKVWKTLNRHRREIGLAVFFYICFHLTAFLFKLYYKKGHLEIAPFFHPKILPGVLAFLLMIPLAATSNDASVKRMGWERWKQLHRLAYLVEAGAFIHTLLQDWRWALFIFLPLGLIQLIRLTRR